MKKRLIVCLGVLLSCCLSAAAQTPEAHVALVWEPSVPLRMLVRAAPVLLPPVPVALAPAVGEPLVDFTAVVVLAKSSEQRRKRLPSIEVVKTVFATEARVPILQLPGWRLQLDGFTSTYDMKYLLLGPAGLGYPVARVPQSARVYGLSLRFRLGRAL